MAHQLLVVPDKGGLAKKADKRPSWAVCGKVTANMETVLFKEKFYDWPEASRLIQVKTESSKLNLSNDLWHQDSFK